MIDEKTNDVPRTYRDDDIQRMKDLIDLIPSGNSALDIGAREGHISKLLAERFDRVTAIDLEIPVISHDGIVCAKGDVTCLEFADDSFDVVVCAEVLEHITPSLLSRACSEISRVAVRNVVVGVPYRQDTRFGRATCYKCGKVSPPYGHVNTFDERKLLELFPKLRLNRFSFTGTHRNRTNPVSTWLADLSGNFYGVYHCGNCIHCSTPLKQPTYRTFKSKMLYKLSHLLRSAQKLVVREQPIWIHAFFDKK